MSRAAGEGALFSCVRLLGRGVLLAFRRCTQQAFLEAHVEAFAWFGGVFALVRYDNLAAAVKLVLRGRRREETIGSSRCARTTCSTPSRWRG